MTYTVHAHRSGKWWALEFPDHPRLHSQCRRLDQVAEQAAAALLDGADIVVSPADIIVEPILNGDFADLVEAANLRAELDTARQQAHAATIAAIRNATAAGLSMRDIGTLLGVTVGYVSQLAAADA